MVANFNTFRTEATKDEWLTPPSVIAALGKFALDPCSPIERPWDTAETHYDLTQDGLRQPWAGRVWLNPPYGGQTFQWVEKLAKHGDGIALTFARTETKGFHREIWEKADALFFFEGRLKFFHVNGNVGGPANAPSVLAAYGAQNVEVLRRVAETRLLRGRFIRLS